MRTHGLILFLALICLSGGVSAQVPGDVIHAGFLDHDTFRWGSTPNADSYNVYRGDPSLLAAGIPAKCHGFQIGGITFLTPAVPEPGNGFFYLVTGVSDVDGEGPPGDDTDSNTRPLLGRCAGVMRNHVLNRIGYGWNEWTRDRVETLGLAGYIQEQLDPATIDESANTDLNDPLLDHIPPEDIHNLIALQILRGVYSHRQLEQQATSFWANHFSTFFIKVDAFMRELFPTCDSPGVPVQCDEHFPARAKIEAANFQYKETETFRNLGFYGNFRQILEASALSPAMLIYLDAVLSTAGDPNENYPREVMELSAMGVDAGYTQADVEELSRAITGWNICKKAIADLDDPLAPCIANYWQSFPPGQFVADFDPAEHDCTEKTLFAGTPEEATIPDTCNDPALGVNDLYLALDAIVAHPATPKFIVGKILKRFVVENPDQAMIDAVVGEWNDDTNLHGIGDLGAVLGAALSLPQFLDPDRVADKAKTPMEHVVSAIRATGGVTDGFTEVFFFLAATAHQVYLNAAPTGWAEAGFEWINTNNMLDRQNLGHELLTGGDPDFSGRPLSLLLDNGVDIGPGNAEAIVDFFSDVLFGGALTPAERQAAIDYLNTDESGVPTPYDNDRIRETVGVMLGYPQFEEQ
jgi:uncharacterized protein (DUF1800 family)